MNFFRVQNLHLGLGRREREKCEKNERRREGKKKENTLKTCVYFLHIKKLIL